MRLKVLRLAMQRQDYKLAAHAVTYGLIKARIEELHANGKTRRTPRQSKR